MIWRTISAAAALGGIAISGAVADEATPTSPPASAEWDQVLKALRSDAFAEREKAAASLVALPREALPWLDAKLEGAAADDPEFVQRLASAAKMLRDRIVESDLEGGLQVSLAMEEAKADAIFKAIQDAAPRPLLGSDAKSPWADGVPSGYFEFEGSYWAAIDHLFEEYPPGAASDPGREKVDQEHDLLAFGESDFAGVAQPSASAGVLRVRAARTALEHSNGKDFLTITLVPKLEPTYLPDEVSLLLREVKFADGETVEPESRLRRFERSGYQTATTFHPGKDFTWELPVTEGLDLGGPVELDLKAQLKLRRMAWQQHDLPEVGQSVVFEPSITLTVEESEEDYIKVKFEGEGGTRIDFNQYTRHGMRRLFEILDEDGNEIDFNIRSSSSGSGANDSWHQSYKCYFEDETPTTVRALIPGEQRTHRMPISIGDVPLPAIGR